MRKGREGRNYSTVDSIDIDIDIDTDDIDIGIVKVIESRKIMYIPNASSILSSNPRK